MGSLIQLSNENAKLIKNSQGKQENEERFGESEYKGFIIDRAKPQQEIDTQIDRMDDGLQKNESPEESHELEREEYRNTGGGGKFHRGWEAE